MVEMVQIVAIIRPNKLIQTKEALSDAGFPAYTCKRVSGRGKHPIDPHTGTFQFSLVPKRLFSVVVPTESADRAVRVIMDQNSEGRHGDGKIFVFPVMETYQIRNGSNGTDTF